MIKSHLMQLIFQYIPEVLVLSFLGAVFLGVKLNKKKIFIIAIITAIITYLVRILPLNFGYHTIIAVLVFTLLLTKLYSRGLLNSFLSALKTYILLAVVEMGVFKLLVNILGITADKIVGGSFKIRTIATLLLSFFLLIIGLIILYFKKRKAENNNN